VDISADPATLDPASQHSGRTANHGAEFQVGHLKTAKFLALRSFFIDHRECTEALLKFAVAAGLLCLCDW